MIITAPIPVMGRFPLVRLTVSRLKSQGVIPIMMGHEKEAEDIAKQLDMFSLVLKLAELCVSSWNGHLILTCPDVLVKLAP